MRWRKYEKKERIERDSERALMLNYETKKERIERNVGPHNKIERDLERDSEWDVMLKYEIKKERTERDLGRKIK